MYYDRIVAFVVAAILVGGIVWASANKNEPSFGAATQARVVVLAGSKDSTTNVVTKMFAETTTDPIIKTVELGSGIDQLNLNTCVTASSTVAQVNVAYESSDDNVNWFSGVNPFISVSPSSTVNLLVATSSFNFVPGSIEQRCVSIPTIISSSRFFRFKFTRGVANDSNYSFYAELIPKGIH